MMGRVILYSLEKGVLELKYQNKNVPGLVDERPPFDQIAWGNSDGLFLIVRTTTEVVSASWFSFGAKWCHGVSFPNATSLH